MVNSKNGDVSCKKPGVNNYIWLHEMDLDPAIKLGLQTYEGRGCHVPQIQ